MVPELGGRIFRFRSRIFLFRSRIFLFRSRIRFLRNSFRFRFGGSRLSAIAAPDEKSGANVMILYTFFAATWAILT
jgi:hypothetical protein